MTRVETKIVRKTINMTTLALAAAQVALMCGNAHAQTAATSEQDAKDGSAQTVIVTGQRKQLETATAIKRDSDQIVDAVVADEAGKLPDKYVAAYLIVNAIVSAYGGVGRVVKQTPDAQSAQGAKP